MFPVLIVITIVESKCVVWSKLGSVGGSGISTYDVGRQFGSGLVKPSAIAFKLSIKFEAEIGLKV